ncbi:MAG: hypothetical protein ACK5Q5_19630 [Planctomycetaceae bacterium]
MICHFCDHRNATGRKHCKSCGAELPFDAPPPTAAADFDEAGRRLERDVVFLLKTDGLIPAIRHYREVTGLGLKESKEAVEQIAQVHDVMRPPQPGAGCVTVFVAVIATLTLAWTCVVVGAGRWPW